MKSKQKRTDREAPPPPLVNPPKPSYQSGGFKRNFKATHREAIQLAKLPEAPGNTRIGLLISRSGEPRQNTPARHALRLLPRYLGGSRTRCHDSACDHPLPRRTNFSRPTHQLHSHDSITGQKTCTNATPATMHGC